MVKKIVLLLAFFGILVYVLPNLWNEKEKRAFEENHRLFRARKLSSTPKDSVAVVPGEYYKRSEFFQFFLGSNYRDLWQREVKTPTLDLQNYQGGLSPVEFSGGQQTIGIEARDSLGRTWSIRSVNKDQANALADFLKPSFLRPMFRDQTSSLNPYAAPVSAKLAAAVDIHHSNPELFYFPYDSSLGKYNQRMAGRLVLVDEEVDEGWAGAPRFGFPDAIVDSDEMLEKRRKHAIPVDSTLYLRSRLFDMLISDWDRHEGNWKWVLKSRGSEQIFEPFPVDRDMALYKFGEGIINKGVLLFLDKFQSFTPEYKNVEGLMHQSKNLDMEILRNMPVQAFLKEAAFLQQRLDAGTIETAFREYPREIYRTIGNEHEQILKKRLADLPAAAKKFHDLIQED